VNAAVILGVGLFALGGVSVIPPLRDLERRMVQEISLRLDPVESAFSGNGSQDRPWQRWKTKPALASEPVRVLSVDDDPDAWFSSSPPSPVDCALMFSRLREAGHSTVGCGYLMAWDDPEALALLALRKQLDELDSAVLGLPLARGAVAEPLPASFLRLSVDAKQIDGDVSSLPQMNRVAVPNAELGGERTLAGFTILENEKNASDTHPHVIARWGERIIFSLPLATEIAALKIDPEEIRILSGSEIRLGIGGPVIPVDEFGRTPIAPDAPILDIPAWKIVAEDNPVPPARDPLLIRDHRDEMPEADRAWSDDLPRAAHTLRIAPRYQKPVILSRLEALAEMALFGLIVLFAAWAASLERFGWRLLTVLMAAALSAELVYLFAARQNLWLPPLAITMVGVSSFLLAFIPGPESATKVKKHHAPWEIRRDPVSEPEPAVAPVAVPAPLVEAPSPLVVSAPAPLPPLKLPLAPVEPEPVPVAPPEIVPESAPASLEPELPAIRVEIPEPAFIAAWIVELPEGFTRIKVSALPPQSEPAIEPEQAIESIQDSEVTIPLPDAPADVEEVAVELPQPQTPASPSSSSTKKAKISKKSRRKGRR
jgi:hypothetical protein